MLAVAGVPAYTKGFEKPTAAKLFRVDGAFV